MVLSYEGALPAVWRTVREAALSAVAGKKSGVYRGCVPE
jgi:hypothetical protein